MKTFALRKLMENKEQEDREDLNAFKERCNEPLIPLEEVVNGLSNKETCRWTSEDKIECDFFHSYRVCISCDHTKEFTVQYGSEIDYRYCPYCGKEIEEIDLD